MIFELRTFFSLFLRNGSSGQVLLRLLILPQKDISIAWIVDFAFSTF